MEKASYSATILAAIVAVVTLIMGSCQFNQTQEIARTNLKLQAETLAQDRETKAIEIFQKFNEQNQEIASAPAPMKEKDLYWRYNAMLANTESVFRLTHGDAGWEKTVMWMLEVQQPFLQKNQFDCETFNADFLMLMKKSVPSLKCDKF